MPSHQTGWWLEDARPGVTIRHAHGRTIDEAEHVWLAWVTHNVSGVHGDSHRAASGAFGQPVVLGALTAAIVIGLAEPAAAGPESVPRGLLGGWHSIELRGTVVAGDTLRAASRIEVVTPDAAPGWGLVTRTITGTNQRGEVIAMIQEVDRQVPSRSVAQRSGQQ